MPIAASAGSKKTRAKKAATKEPINYMLSIRVFCGDKKFVEESSMECLQELESTSDYGKELQKQSVVVAVKLRHRGLPYALKVEQKLWVRVILVVLSRLWGGGVADRGTDKGADFFSKKHHYRVGL